MDDPILWSLITLQVAMGAFDTLVHHEGSERLGRGDPTALVLSLGHANTFSSQATWL